MGSKMAEETAELSPELQNIKVAAYIAAFDADRAGQTCKQVVREALHVLHITGKRLELATSKAETKVFSWHRIRLSDVYRFRDVSKRISHAMRVLKRLINRAEIAGIGAISAADDTNEKAHTLSRLILMKMDFSGAVSTVNAAIKLAKDRRKLAKEAIYLVLKGMEECLIAADFEITDSWMDMAGDFITPVTVGGCVLSSYMYHHLDKIKDTFYYSVLGVKIPCKVLIPGTIIACFILSAIQSCLEDNKHERQVRTEILAKAREDLSYHDQYFCFQRIPVPSLEEAKNEILGTEA